MFPSSSDYQGTNIGFVQSPVEPEMDPAQDMMQVPARVIQQSMHYQAFLERRVAELEAHNQNRSFYLN